MEEDLKTKLNRETAKAEWSALAPFFAGDRMVAVKSGVDLIEVAVHIAENNVDTVKTLQDNGTIFRPDENQALHWHEQKSVLWAVVINPWVLVQETSK